MGAIADAIVAYAQPLIDQTDGSLEQMQKAFSISQFCYNLSLLPEESRGEVLAEMKQELNMDDGEFGDFMRSVVSPMVQRHERMFPFLHRRVSHDPVQRGSSLRAHANDIAPAEKHPVTDRYAPCPCNSGKKYKFCCGNKGR
jgi:SEC-C motif